MIKKSKLNTMVLAVIFIPIMIYMFTINWSMSGSYYNESQIEEEIYGKDDTRGQSGGSAYILPGILIHDGFVGLINYHNHRIVGALSGLMGNWSDADGKLDYTATSRRVDKLTGSYPTVGGVLYKKNSKAYQDIYNYYASFKEVTETIEKTAKADLFKTYMGKTWNNQDTNSKVKRVKLSKNEAVLKGANGKEKTVQITSIKTSINNSIFNGYDDSVRIIQKLESYLKKLERLKIFMI